MPGARRWLITAFLATLLGGLIAILHNGSGSGPALGTLLDPADGLFRTARLTASDVLLAHVGLPGTVDSVHVYFDARGVPHIFAEDEFDAIRALGYVMARDRLFQLDFIPRVAAGRLSELIGEAALDADRFLRRTGMEDGARLNAARIEREKGVEKATVDAFCAGVNGYLDSLAARDLPLEFRLLGGRPQRCNTLQVMRVLAYMTLDLTYRSDEAVYGTLQQRLGPDDYTSLYPKHTPSSLYVPVVHDDAPVSSSITGMANPAGVELISEINNLLAPAGLLLAEGFRSGKGSNNWAVSAKRSETAAPILAGDMHLALTLPAIWYEVHLVTPEMNTYGVAIPGAPLPVEAFNDYLGWTFTNTGADQIDHYALELDSSRTRYRFNGRWREKRAPGSQEGLHESVR
ncbi:MAG: penicillin acylase family protein, partial [Rhodothermales bacterium]